MGNKSCCSGPGEGDKLSVGRGSQPGKANHVAVSKENGFKAFEKPIRMTISPASFGVSGFKIQSLGMKLQPVVQALIQRNGLFTWLPVSPGYNASLAVYKANMMDGQYVGQMQGQIRQGKGYLLTLTGDLIACMFEGDLPNGRGVIYFANGDYFEGLMVNGETSEGKITYNDGSYYVGEMCGQGFIHGNGMLYDRDGNAKFEGSWSNTHREGVKHQQTDMFWQTDTGLGELPAEHIVQSPQPFINGSQYGA